MRSDLANNKSNSAVDVQKKSDSSYELWENCCETSIVKKNICLVETIDSIRAW